MQKQNSKTYRKCRLFGACLLAVMLGMLIAPPADAQMFANRKPGSLSRVTNQVAKRRGDLLMVVVNETTDVQNRDERSMDKVGTSTGIANFGYGFGGGLGTGEATGDINHQTSMQRGFTGDTEFLSQRVLLDRFTVRVAGVYDNGNMRIVGHRTINLQGDVRELQMSGVIRNIDVLANNTVESHMISDLRINLVGKGPEQKFNKQGTLARRINRWWPF